MRPSSITRFAISTCTTRYKRYIPVRQVTGTQTALYRVVPSKIDRQRSILAVDGRLKKKSTVGAGRLLAVSVAARGSPARRRHPRVACCRFCSRTRRWSVSLRGEKDRGDIMQSIGFLGPAFFLTQLSHVRTPALAVLCMACTYHVTIGFSFPIHFLSTILNVH
ncbi:hypothetical protein BHE74_00024970 [Ensete ventricosum]|nr:hypothetical protein BHE74_00024970 [Ensete ventricosum]